MSFDADVMASVFVASLICGLAAADARPGAEIATATAAIRHVPASVGAMRSKEFSLSSDTTSGGGSESRLERARGIEPRPAAWKAVILPLNHARLVLVTRPVSLPNGRRSRSNSHSSMSWGSLSRRLAPVIWMNSALSLKFAQRPRAEITHAGA